MKRTLLFLDYWSLREPLTQATVMPTLHMVLEDRLADRIVLVTVERGSRAVSGPAELGEGIVHRPLVAGRAWPRALSRAWDVLGMVPRIAAIAREERVANVMARGVVAGGLAHFVHRRTGIPYAVDYVEPHNEYMTDVGEWTRGGALDRGLAWLIKAQLRSARFGVTVANNYLERLVAMGVPRSKLLNAPCPVDVVRMRFDQAQRTSLRAHHGWGDARIGVYAGKFGGLYHREHAFRAFAEAQRHAGDGYVTIILTPQPEDEVRAGLRAAGYAGERVLVRYAEHHEVPAYLSAADFAFAPYRATPSSACISPMKLGEYWASGLPVLLSRGVGDDSAIIERELFAGALFDPLGADLAVGMARIQNILTMPDQRTHTGELAARYRSMEFTRQAYRRILGGATASA